MSIFNNANIVAGASGKQRGYTIEESLRFNASQSSYLSRTFGSGGNLKTYTISFWIKRGKLGAQQFAFTGFNGSISGNIQFTSSDTLTFNVDGGVNYQLITSQVFRDPSAWYHVVCVADTTQATASNRLKIYINGVQVTSFGTAAYPTLNYDTKFFGAYSHWIGASQIPSLYIDGYLAEFNAIDGQALDPSSFGEFDSVTGVWKPAEYTGTYGTNGFYLPMQLDNTTEGFNTVTYEGNGSTQQISGVGFSPDLVWIKNRDNATSHSLYDTIRGADVTLRTNTTDQDFDYGNTLLSFNTDGFTVGDYSHVNANNESHVAWCWDAGDTTVSNDAGSITSSVRANPTYGFSVVTYTGTGANATVGHGLGTAPSMVIVKQRSTTTSWAVYHSGLTSAAYVINLNLTSGQAGPNSVFWNNTAPTSTVFSLGTGTDANASGATAVAYCFSEVAGYSKFGTYQNNNSTTGVTVTTGFRPAFIMLKCTDAGERWFILDNTRQVNNVAPPSTAWLVPNATSTEGTNGAQTATIDFLDDGFQIKTTNPASGEVSFGTRNYIYMAFADTREYAFWLDDSGNNNDWQPKGGITTSSTVTDTPTIYADGGNYAVLNPIDRSGNGFAATTSNANLSAASSGNPTHIWSTITLPVGGTEGWYWEGVCTSMDTARTYVGIIDPTTTSGAPGASYAFVDKAILSRTGGYYNTGSGTGGTASATFTAYAVNDVVMIAYKNGKIWFGKNGTWMNSGDPAADTNAVDSAVSTAKAWRPYFGYNSSWTANFGQRPFAYTPPTGFLPLHTGNLPDSAIVDGSDYFNAITYTGTGASVARTGVGFQPDLVWYKSRSVTENHGLFDVVRGVQQSLYSNLTNAEATDPGVYSFDADGFTAYNSAYTYVAWNWKANGAGVSNTDGSITSTVSANPTSGFSIVTYTGNATNGATVGHGLGVSPSMIIGKIRSTTGDWYVWQTAMGDNFMRLNTTGAQAASTGNGVYNTGSFSSTVFALGSGSSMNTSGGTYVAYCFSEVEGYSKFGSYVGNNSADGPFVYLGFRPAFLIIRSTSGARDWLLWDTARGTANGVGPMDGALQPNTSGTPYTGSGYEGIDLVSNGFKWRNNASPNYNTTETHIYMAFAENPFKNSLAR